MRGRHLVAACLAAFLAMGVARAADNPKLVDFEVATKKDGYHASLRLEGAFPQDVLDTIESGLPVTFQYRVEIYQRRALWADPVFVRRMVNVSVDFDSLTRQYHLTREIDGQVVDSASTEKPDEMRRWMTRIAVRLGELPEDAEIDSHPWVRARCRLASRFVLFFFPQASETRWVRTPLPPRVEEEESP